jgi:hypothetical protein
MVQAAWEIHKWMERPARDFLGKIKTLVITLAGINLELFACYAIATDWDKKDGYPEKVEYHVFRLERLDLELMGSKSYAGSPGTRKTGAMPSPTH